MTTDVRSIVNPGMERLARAVFGKHPVRCRRGPVVCQWRVLGTSAVCTIGGEIASVGTNGEITKLEVRRGQ